MSNSKKESRLFSVLSATDKTYRTIPKNIKLLISAVSKALPDFGPRKLLRKGSGTEFFETRDYDPQLDDARKINAKISAKLDKPMVIEKQAELSQRIYLWRDADAPMDYASEPTLFTKKEAAEIMMLAFAKHLTKNEEVVGVLDQKGTLRGGKVVENMARSLDVRVITGDMPVLRSNPPKNSTAVLFSDFVNKDANKLGKELQRLRSQGLSGHLVMILDPQEIDFNYQGFIKFEGMKGELTEEFGKAEEARKLYRGKLAAHIHQLKTLANSNGFNLILQRTDEPFQYGLMQLYGYKSKEQVLDPILSLHENGGSEAKTEQSNTQPKPR